MRLATLAATLQRDYAAFLIATYSARDAHANRERYPQRCNAMVHGAGACDGALIMVPGQCIVLAHVLVHRAGASCWCMVLVHWCIVLMHGAGGDTPFSASAFCVLSVLARLRGLPHRNLSIGL
jgi:hypothetical protein